MYPKYW